ncbi:MAG: cyclic pyranopterin monophosphate synthase MoaC, partial [Candidatus Bathyarchaeia archaeon]
MAMVDITGKPKTFREATATGKIRLKPETISLIKSGKVEKGDP